MKPDDAHTLAGFLKAAFPSMTPEQIEVYENNLLYEDAALASKAILDGIREWKFPPRYAEIVERIRMFRRLAQVDEPREEYVNRGREDPPFWVRRWIVARYIAEPRDMRVFREQGRIPFDAIPDEGWMPEDAWVEEAKTLTPQQLRAAMTASVGVGG